MPLVSGTKLGPYEVVGLLGAGGMAEVYRASDTQLGRDVALKVLPATFLRDPGRMVRFQREAKVLASLEHSNIGHIYGIVDAEDSHALAHRGTDAFVEEDIASSEHIWFLPVGEGKNPPRQWLNTRFNGSQPDWLPDGHWITYTSNESGREEVYVQENACRGLLL